MLLEEDCQAMGSSDHQTHLPQLTFPGTVQRIHTHNPVVGGMSIKETISGYTNTCWAFLWLSFPLSFAEYGSSYFVKLLKGKEHLTCLNTERSGMVLPE